jgi:hypothetical protein
MEYASRSTISNNARSIGRNVELPSVSIVALSEIVKGISFLSDYSTGRDQSQELLSSFREGCGSRSLALAGPLSSSVQEVAVRPEVV